MSELDTQKLRALVFQKDNVTVNDIMKNLKLNLKQLNDIFKDDDFKSISVNSIFARKVKIDERVCNWMGKLSKFIKSNGIGDNDAKYILKCIKGAKAEYISGEREENYREKIYKELYDLFKKYEIPEKGCKVVEWNKATETLGNEIKKMGRKAKYASGGVEWDTHDHTSAMANGKMFLSKMSQNLQSKIESKTKKGKEISNDLTGLLSKVETANKNIPNNEKVVGSGELNPAPAYRGRGVKKQ